MIRRIGAFLSLVCLLMLLPVQQARAAEIPEQVPQLLSYYRYYGSEAAGDIQRLLEEMAEENPAEAARWREIMTGWRYVNEDMPLHTGCLPDGLPEDDSLCIVVMGFKLSADGSVKPELLDRLTVALESAKKYPNAFLLCTGGATSDRADVTEAGQMKAWLVDAGVAPERILMETRAATTPENAVYGYELLQRSCPQVSKIAVITSDYHIYRSMILFAAQALLEDLPYTVMGNAVCTTEKAGQQELEKQAKNLAELADVHLDSQEKPELLTPETIPPPLPPETVPETVPETLPATEPPATVSVPEPTDPPAEPEPGIPGFALAGFTGTLALALVLTVLAIRIGRRK